MEAIMILHGGFTARKFRGQLFDQTLDHRHLCL